MRCHGPPPATTHELGEAKVRDLDLGGVRILLEQQILWLRHFTTKHWTRQESGGWVGLS